MARFEVRFDTKRRWWTGVIWPLRWTICWILLLLLLLLLLKHLCFIVIRDAHMGLRERHRWLWRGSKR